MKRHSKDRKSSIRKESKIINFIFLLKLCYPSTWAKLCLNGKMEVSWCTKRWSHSFFHADHPGSPATLGWWLQRQPCSAAGCPSERAPTQVTKPCNSALKSKVMIRKFKSQMPQRINLLFCLQRRSPETTVTLGSQEQEMTVYMMSAINKAISIDVRAEVSSSKTKSLFKTSDKKEKGSEAQTDPQLQDVVTCQCLTKAICSHTRIVQGLNVIWMWGEGGPREDSESYLIPKEMQRGSRSGKGLSSVFILALCRPDTAGV